MECGGEGREGEVLDLEAGANDEMVGRADLSEKALAQV